MRIGVIGAGAVGGSMAAVLARAGHDVEVTARGAHLAAIRERGIRLEGGWGAFTARVTANPVLTGPAELVIVATKAQDAESAIRDNLAMLEGAVILVVQNGLDGIATAQRLLPSAEIAGGLSMIAASYLEPGLITVTTPGPTHIGGPAAEHVEQLIGTDAPIVLSDNFEGAQWTKLFINQVNALPAITGLYVQQVIADDGLRRVLTASMRETVRVAFAAGVRFAPIKPLTHRLLWLFANVPVSWAERMPRAMATRMGSVPNPGSTLQSIRRGQRTEVDYLNGAVVAHGHAPINAALTAMVHEVEASGSFLSPADVVARVFSPTTGTSHSR